MHFLLFGLGRATQNLARVRQLKNNSILVFLVILIIIGSAYNVKALLRNIIERAEFQNNCEDAK